MQRSLITLVLALLLLASAASAQTLPRQRAIILTDIEAEVDDSQSMVRLMLYSNQIEIKGLIATTSVWLRDRVAPDAIRATIAAYGKVRANLLKHETGYPDPAELLKVVKPGIPEFGMKGVGEGKDSPGSRWIITVLEEQDPRPLWVCVWGGSNTLAQALYTIRKTKSASEARALIGKLRVYTISDQDDSGHWMRDNFPDLFYIVSPGGYVGSTWIAIMEHGDGVNNEVVSNAWLARNIQQGHGPLGALYPDVAYGMEGDTPSWLGLVPNGLNAPEHPAWGGWGGRYELATPDFAAMDPNGFTGGVPMAPETRPIWTNASDRFFPVWSNERGRAIRTDTVSFTGHRYTLQRWREDFQNDFAARMAWCTKPYGEVNHPPVPRLAHPDTLTVRSGDAIHLSAAGSTDPDGDNLSYLWFQYPEAGTYKEFVKVDGAENMVRFTAIAPEVQARETLHFILRVTDKGTPPLSRYKRIIVTVVPR